MVRLIDHLDMTIVVDWDIKQQNKQKLFLLEYLEAILLREGCSSVSPHMWCFGVIFLCFLFEPHHSKMCLQEFSIR